MSFDDWASFYDIEAINKCKTSQAYETYQFEVGVPAILQPVRGSRFTIAHRVLAMSDTVRNMLSSGRSGVLGQQ